MAKITFSQWGEATVAWSKLRRAANNYRRFKNSKWHTAYLRWNKRLDRLMDFGLSPYSKEGLMNPPESAIKVAREIEKIERQRRSKGA